MCRPGHDNETCIGGFQRQAMAASDDVISGLREALRVSPNNLPLRQTLADLLAGNGRYEEAEAKYRNALGRSPENPKLKTGPATAFFRQTKVFSRV